jgi:hypothetical protein
MAILLKMIAVPDLAQIISVGRKNYEHNTSTVNSNFRNIPFFPSILIIYIERSHQHTHKNYLRT